jgi:hypothetical protein
LMHLYASTQTSADCAALWIGPAGRGGGVFEWVDAVSHLLC